MAQQEITIYHAAPTRSSRVVLLLEELGLPYKAVSVDFPNELFTPAFLKVNPMGTCVDMHHGASASRAHVRPWPLQPDGASSVYCLCRIPYFIDGDIKLSESLAIMYYLLDKYGAQQHACSSAKQKYRSRDIQVNGCTVYERIERPFGVSIAHHHRCQAATGNGKLEPAKSDISNRAQFYEVTRLPAGCWLPSKTRVTTLFTKRDRESIGVAALRFRNFIALHA